MDKLEFWAKLFISKYFIQFHFSNVKLFLLATFVSILQAIQDKHSIGIFAQRNFFSCCCMSKLGFIWFYNWLIYLAINFVLFSLLLHSRLNLQMQLFNFCDTFGICRQFDSQWKFLKHFYLFHGFTRWDGLICGWITFDLLCLVS